MKLVAKSTDNQQYLVLEGADASVIRVTDAAIIKSYPVTEVVEWATLSEEVLEKSFYDLLLEKYNKFHAPPGTRQGGRFMSRRQAQAAGLTLPGDSNVPAGEIWVTPTATKGPVFGNVRSTNYTVPLSATKTDRNNLEAVGINESRMVASMQIAMETVDPDHLNGINVFKFQTNLPDGYGGSFDLQDRTIVIDPTNTSANNTENNSLTMEHAIKHEVGHNVWLENLTPEQRITFGYMVGYPNPEELGDLGWIDNPAGNEELANRILSTPVNSVTEYGQKSILESWSEYYALID